MLPGAKLVLTQDLTERPFSIAFFATSPAAIITLGFEVLVQLVMAAITISPVCIWSEGLLSIIGFVSNSLKDWGISFNKILSWGLLGPATEASIVPRSRLIFSSNFGA